MFSPSDYNDAVPQFTNGNYANTPLNPLYVEEPDAVNYNRGSEPLQTLPAQWWNWLCNKITAKLNKLNIYVKNIFDELTQLLSLVGITPDATEEEITTGQLKGMFQTQYPQYLFDNFRFESVLQGRTRGVMIPPTDSWDNDTDTLSLTGGFGIINSYQKVVFSDCDLTLQNDSAIHYIVSDEHGTISIESTLEDDVILVGLCYDKEYCLLIDNNPDQCKDNIILKKWFGQNKITQDFVPVLQSYYNITISSISTNIKIIELPTSTRGIDFENDKLLNNCNIQIDTVLSSGYAIYSGTFSNCDITVDRLNASSSYAIYKGTFTNCNITINEANNNTETKCIATTATFTNCSIFGKNIATMFRGSGRCYNCIIRLNNVRCCCNNFNFYNCDVEIEHVQFRGFVDAHCYDCTIRISNVDSGGEGMYTGDFSCCIVVITTVASGSSGIRNTAAVKLTLTSISATAVTDLSYTGGKLNVLNNAVLHTS